MQLWHKHDDTFFFFGSWSASSVRGAVTDTRYHKLPHFLVILEMMAGVDGYCYIILDLSASILFGPITKNGRVGICLGALKDLQTKIRKRRKWRLSNGGWKYGSPFYSSTFIQDLSFIRIGFTANSMVPQMRSDLHKTGPWATRFHSKQYCARKELPFSCKTSRHVIRHVL